MSRPYGKTCVPDFELYRKTFQLWGMGKDMTHGLSLEKRCKQIERTFQAGEQQLQQAKGSSGEQRTWLEFRKDWEGTRSDHEGPVFHAKVLDFNPRIGHLIVGFPFFRLIGWFWTDRLTSLHFGFLTHFVVVQSLSRVRLFATPWTAACQASLSSTISQSLFKLMSILTISSSVALFSSCPQSFPASGSFPMSWLFVSGSQTVEASFSVSVLPMNIQGWFSLRLTGLISL